MLLDSLAVQPHGGGIPNVDFYCHEVSRAMAASLSMGGSAVVIVAPRVTFFLHARPYEGYVVALMGKDAKAGRPRRLTKGDRKHSVITEIHHELSKAEPVEVLVIGHSKWSWNQVQAQLRRLKNL